jgi:mediator of RNA polymerase II transcription subunit 12, fungi type
MIKHGTNDRMGLSARLYNEHLLDQDHYLGWMLSSLESSTLDKLPIWLSIVQVYCENLLRYRKTGRQLVEILLGKLRQVSNGRLEGDYQDILTQFV